MTQSKIAKDVEMMINNRLSSLKMIILDAIDAEIKEQKTLESNAQEAERREFFKGTHVGMMSAYILIGKLFDQ